MQAALQLLLDCFDKIKGLNHQDGSLDFEFRYIKNFLANLKISDFNSNVLEYLLLELEFDGIQIRIYGSIHIHEQYLVFTKYEENYLPRIDLTIQDNREQFINNIKRYAELAKVMGY